MLKNEKKKTKEQLDNELHETLFKMGYILNNNVLFNIYERYDNASEYDIKNYKLKRDTYDKRNNK